MTTHDLIAALEAERDQLTKSAATIIAAREADIRELKKERDRLRAALDNKESQYAESRRVSQQAFARLEEVVAERDRLRAALDDVVRFRDEVMHNPERDGLRDVLRRGITERDGLGDVLRGHGFEVEP